MMKQWCEELFKNYVLKYDRESFIRGTIGQCDFIEKTQTTTKPRKSQIAAEKYYYRPKARDRTIADMAKSVL